MSYTDYHWRIFVNADPSEHQGHKDAMINLMAELAALEEKYRDQLPYLSIETWW